MFQQELTGKKPGGMRKNTRPLKNKTYTAGPEYVPVSRLLSLQQTAGNRAVQRMVAAGTHHTNAGSVQAIRGTPGSSGVPSATKTQPPAPTETPRQAPATCSLGSDEGSMKTVIEKNAPPGYYGASFNHTFPAVPVGCSLAGGTVSEVVTTQRDDFRIDGSVALGRKIWTLTKENRLSEPDRIWTQAGPKGLGINPLKRGLPAVLDQNQLWYYKVPNGGSWMLGPGTILTVTLDGDIKRKETLTVTTTDHTVSRREPYRGPDLQVEK